MASRLLLVALAIALFGSMTSCGHEDPTGTLHIDSTPPGAAIRLDGVDTDDVTPAEYQLPVGPHAVSVALAGHVVAPIERTITVGPGRLVAADFALAALGELTVTSDPAGGAILLDGEDTGEITPHTFSLVEGMYTVEVVLDGHASDGSRAVEIDAAAPVTATFDLVAAGTLTVTATHAGLAIYIDGFDTGEVTPHTFTKPVGSYRVNLQQSGYTVDPAFIDVAVAAGAESVAHFTTVNVTTWGGLLVTSTPPGAAIRLDDADTGEITPHEFILPSGMHQVRLTRAGFHDTAVEDVFVAPQMDTGADFTLVARRIVLMEYMSGVNCEGCPAMNTMLRNVEAAGYGPDRLLGIKYSGPFGGGDLHYDENPQVLQDRMTWYANNTAWNWAAPTLMLDGALTVEPNGYPALGDLVTLLDGGLSADPGFAIDVSLVDPTALDFEVIVELLPTREVVHANTVLNVAIVENPVLYDAPQNEAGESEFHWICREFVQGDASPLPIAPGTPAVFEIDVTRLGTWTGVPDNLIAIAFVQDAVTLEVLQAGASENAHTGDNR